MQAIRSMQQVVEGIQALDLGPIKFKLMDGREGEGWTREFVERMEVEYKRFLTLLAKYPHDPIAPSKDVDKFWHGHILDTQKYIDDCDRVFGFYLHHFPYFGMRGADDAAALTHAGERTRELYAAEFGPQAQGADSGWCSAAAETKAASQPAWCSSAAKAWCSSAAEAWCSAAGEKKSVGQPAWCSSAAEAWCSAAGEKKSARQPAWCSASRGGIDTTTRPSLPPVS